MRTWLLTILFLSAALAACFGNGDRQTATSASNDKLILSATKPGSRMDPHLDVQWEVLYVLSAVYDTLIYQDGEGGFVPGLARSWTVSDDGLRYLFQLRNDVTFHDGSAFNAEAVKFNIERIQSLGARSLKASSLLASVKAVTVPDTYTVAIELSRPDAFFLFNLSLPYIAMVSPTAVQEWGDAYHLHQSGTGPFKFVEYRPGNRYRLQRNPAYQWAPEIYHHHGAARLREIEWRFLPEPSSRAPALEAGDVNVAFDLVPTNLNRILNSPTHRIETAYLTGQPSYWFINTQRAPTDELAVRKAMLYAADMVGGTKAITRGISPPSFGPLAQVTPEYSHKLDTLYPHNPDKARALLDAAGWIDRDGDGVREKDGKPLTVTMSMVSWGQSRSFSVLLQSQLREVGIDLELEMLDHAVQIAAGRRGLKNMLFTGSSGYSAADSLRPFFHSENADDGFAFSKFKDPELDRLIEDAEVTLDKEARFDLYERAQLRIMEQALILPIYDYALLIGVEKRVQGLSWHSVGLVPSFYEMYLEEGP